MSTEFDIPQSAPVKKHTKRDRQDQERIEKKRKRILKHDEKSTPPKKKSRSDTHQESGAEIPKFQTSLDTSPFHEQRISLFLSVAPIAQQQPLQAVCAEHLSPLVLTYYPPLRGVIISYRNPRLCNSPNEPTDEEHPLITYARTIDEYGASFVWLTVDFLIFRPQTGDVIEGYINLQNETGIGLVCWNFFNANVDSAHLPRSWKWAMQGTHWKKLEKLKSPGRSADSPERSTASSEEEEQEQQPHTIDERQGFFQDEQGKMVEGAMVFGIKNVETSRTLDAEHGFLSVEGTMSCIKDADLFSYDRLQDPQEKAQSKGV